MPVLAEWLKATCVEAGVPARGPWVRILTDGHHVTEEV
jgi:hypothetical protein